MQVYSSHGDPKNKDTFTVAAQVLCHILLPCVTAPQQGHGNRTTLSATWLAAARGGERGPRASEVWGERFWVDGQHVQPWGEAGVRL